MALKKTWPFIELVPPATLPRGTPIFLKSGLDIALYCQSNSVPTAKFPVQSAPVAIPFSSTSGISSIFSKVFPASINNTLVFGFSDNLEAMTAPDEPAPIII